MTTWQAKARRKDLEELIRCLGVDETRVVQQVHWAEKLCKQDYAALDRQAVLDRYHGLIEKYRVIGRVDLSDALVSRVEQLEKLKEDYSTIQCASMLLDIPATPPKLLAFRDDDTRTSPQLTWEDIIKEEPLVGEHWNLELESESSISFESEPEYYEPVSEPSESRSVEDITVEPLPKPINAYVYSSSNMEVREESLYWCNGQVRVSEADVMRECLIAMSGLSSELFEIELKDGFFCCCMLNGNGEYRVEHLSQTALSSLLSKIATHVTTIAQLRQFSDPFYLLSEFPNYSYRYIFGVVDSVLQEFGKNLQLLEKAMFESKNTLLAFERKLEDLVAPYTSLVNVLKSSTMTAHIQVALLDQLYETIYNLELSHVEGNAVTLLTKVFFKIFENYPLVPWLERGEGSPGFAFGEHPETDISCYWTSAHYDTNLPLPKFLKSTKRALFNAGRCAGFLLRMDSDQVAAFRMPLASTMDIFTLQLQQGIHQHDQTVTSQLTDHLIHKCNLKSVLATHFDLFFLQDKSGCMVEFLSLANAEHSLDRHKANDLLHEAYRPTKPPCFITSVEPLQIGIKLAKPELGNVVTPECAAKYTACFTALSQLSRTHQQAVANHDWYKASQTHVSMSEVYTFTIIPSIQRFWKAMDTNSSNIIQQHEQLLDSILATLTAVS